MEEAVTASSVYDSSDHSTSKKLKHRMLEREYEAFYINKQQKAHYEQLLTNGPYTALVKAESTEQYAEAAACSKYFHGNNQLTELKHVGELGASSNSSDPHSSTVVERDCTFNLSDRLVIIKDHCKTNEIAYRLLKIESKLADELMKLDYGDRVSHVYNPVDYAYEPHMDYYKKYCRSTVKVVMVGMNPGPFGMAQSGVPFGDIESVTKWLGISGNVGSPTKIHSKRPISGFDCSRKEVSGSRLWGFLQSMYGTPDDFFNQCFIYNHCPLVYMGSSGKNVTPAQMQANVKSKINKLCDNALLSSLKYFPNCETLVGIGRFAEERIKYICKQFKLDYKQGYLMHPSPRNPTANKDWNSVAIKSLIDLGILDSKHADEVEKAKRTLFTDE